MSFYGNVYYQLVDTFYKIIIRNKGDQIFDFNKNLINPSSTPEEAIVESKASGRKGVFSLESGNYWINFSKNESDDIVAPYSVWHSEPHKADSNKRTSGWDTVSYEPNLDSFGKEKEAPYGNAKQLKANDYLRIYPKKHDEAGHIVPENEAGELYRLPAPQDLYKAINIKNDGKEIRGFEYTLVDTTYSAPGPDTKLDFATGNTWIKLTDATPTGENLVDTHVYQIWHGAPDRKNPVRISGWDYAPKRDERETPLDSQYTITYRVENEGQADELKTEIKITDPKGKVIYDKENGTKDFIDLQEQDFLRIYPAYYDEAGHVYPDTKNEVIYRLPKSAATELAELVGEPKAPIGDGIWFDNIDLGVEQNSSNSILNLFDYAEKNFENITDLREKFGLINTDEKWEFDIPLSGLLGSEEDFTKFKEQYAKDDNLNIETLNILKAITDNKLEIDNADVFAAGLKAQLGEPTTTGVSAFEEIRSNDADIAQLQVDLSEEITRATKAEETLQTNIDNEVDRAEKAELTLQNNIETETTRATNEESRIEGLITTENGRIDDLVLLVGDIDPDAPYDSVNAGIEYNKGIIDEITLAIGNMDNLIEGANDLVAAITLLKGMVDTYNTNLQAAQEKIKELEDKITTLEEFHKEEDPSGEV